MKAFLIILRIVAFIALSTLNFEYLINEQSSTLLTILAIFIEFALYWLLIHPLIKSIFK